MGKRKGISLLAPAKRVSVIQYAPPRQTSRDIDSVPVLPNNDINNSVLPSIGSDNNNVFPNIDINKSVIVPLPPSTNNDINNSVSVSVSPSNDINNNDINNVFPTVPPLVNWILVEDNGEKLNQKFQRLERRAVFKVEHNFFDYVNLMEFQSAIDDAFETTIKSFISDADASDRFSASIEHKSLSKPIYLAPQRVEAFDKRRFLNKVFMVSQSNLEFIADGILNVSVAIYKSLKGSGRTSKAPKTYEQTVHSMKGVIKIRNTDNSCGYRAIAMGMKYWDLKKDCSSTQWQSLTKNESAQRGVGERLCETLGLNFNTPLNIDILQRIQSSINFQIIVINFKTNDQFFCGPTKDKEIYLLYNDEHYDLIKEMTTYTQRDFYCKFCNKAYKKPTDHKCANGCDKCRGPTLCNSGDTVFCELCRNTFYNQKCFESHTSNKVCKYQKYCNNCEINYKSDPKRLHKCDTWKCHECNELYDKQPHHCYLKPLDGERIEKQDKVNTFIVAFDIESMLMKEEDVITHKPILLVSQCVCYNCWPNRNCSVCENKSFYGEDCVKQFNDYVMNLAKKAESMKSQLLCVAHNLSGYDGHFVLKDLLKRDLKNIDPTMNGTKIMKLDIGNIRYIDSLLFFQRPLAELTKMFDIKGETKGFFPHHLNTPQNQQLECLISEIPKEMFGYQQMNSKRASDFDKWYTDNANKIFNLRNDMESYCASDVRILLHSIMKFRDEFKEITKIDPISRCFTLASVGLEYFRTKILTHNLIGITPIKGYTSGRNQSLEALAWLDIMDRQYKSLVREFKIGKYYVDGMLDEPYFEDNQMYTRVAFEYLGCVWHGCHECGFTNAQQLKATEETERRRHYLEKRGIKCNFIKSCDWYRVVKRNGDYYNEDIARHFWSRFNYHKNIRDNELHCIPRKALHGGRTNNLVFSCVSNENQRILYYDFTSLYPFVLARNVFPFGHPQLITRDFRNIKDYFGFVSCKVLPPKQLYLPVLPYSSNGKLVFPLCRTCADSKNNDSCLCSDEERCLIGTFTSIELQKAEDLGYEVKEIFEVLHYEQQNDELFKDYIKTWYKVKTEASGWPMNCNSEQEKHNYLIQFKEREGIELETDKIISNAGKRSIAKLMLNSLWGKLAQRPNQPNTKVVKSFQELWDLFNNEKIEILGEVLIEDMLLLNYKFIDDVDAWAGNTSVAIACFVTAYARLKLYEELEKLENSHPGCVLYFDTDSIIFLYEEGFYKPALGHFLGEMTDETEEFGAGSRITEFYSTGPKCYSYCIETPDGIKEKFKAKGITQTIDARNKVNFEIMKQMAVNPTYTTVVPQQQFRTNRTHDVTTRVVNKQFSVTSDKRRVLGNKTLPYGYGDDDITDDLEPPEFAHLIIDCYEN